MAGVLVAVFAAVSVGLVTSAQAAESAWTGAQIGPPGFIALASNDDGTVVGYISSGAGNAAVVWSNGTATVLDTPENATGSVAAGINNLGEIVGDVTLQGETGVRTEAVRWGTDGAYTLLGVPENGMSSSAMDIDDLGRVVGVASTGMTSYVGFVWDGVGAVKPLPMPLGMTSSFAESVNNVGQIVGRATASGQPSQAILWEDGVATKLEPLAPGAAASALDINDSGKIVGLSSALSIGSHAVLWDDGDIIDLGTLGGSFTAARGINNAGLIVGQTIIGGFLRAYVWEDTVATELPLLEGDVRGSAIAVNAQDEIAGSSTTPAGVWRAVIWRKEADTTAPTITVPADITVNAIRPDGATVEFTVSATDENPTSPAVTCVPPPGSLFPIGGTTVTCAATDEAGNTGTASFTVTVRGAGEQLAALRGDVQGVGPGTSLADKIEAALATDTAGDTPRTCEILNAFIHQVAGAPEKIIDSGTATTVIADATRIRTVLGC